MEELTRGVQPLVHMHNDTDLNGVSCFLFTQGGSLYGCIKKYAATLKNQGNHTHITTAMKNSHFQRAGSRGGKKTLKIQYVSI